MSGEGVRSIVLCCALFVPLVTVAEGAQKTARIHPMPQKPTAERIRKFFSPGVAIGCSRYGKDGTAGLAAGCPSTWCRSSGAWMASGDSVAFRCEKVPGEECGEREELTQPGVSYAEELKIRLMSPELLIFTADGSWDGGSQSGSRRGVLVVAEDCVSDTTQPDISHWCARPTDSAGCDFPERALIQLRAGSRDQGLYRRVKQQIEATAVAEVPGVFIEGPPATTTRLVSEVYFVGEGHRPTAVAVATLLEDVTGPAIVRAWPGDSDYDVVVVVGQKAVGGAAVPAPRRSASSPDGLAVWWNPAEVRPACATTAPRTAKELEAAYSGPWKRRPRVVVKVGAGEQTRQIGGCDELFRVLPDIWRTVPEEETDIGWLEKQCGALRRIAQMLPSGKAIVSRDVNALLPALGQLSLPSELRGSGPDLQDLLLARSVECRRVDECRVTTAANVFLITAVATGDWNNDGFEDVLLLWSAGPMAGTLLAPHGVIVSRRAANEPALLLDAW